MLAAALPWWVASAWFGTHSALESYAAFREGKGPIWEEVFHSFPDLSRADVMQAFSLWPSPPSWPHLAPWVPVMALLGLLGVWLHDGVWDHAGLWVLRGLKAEKASRVRATLTAEAQAQAVSWLGTALGLLTFLPGAGGWVGIGLLPLTAWLWVLRGWALAEHHGCPVWKGVGATLLHLVLFGLFLFVLVALPLLLFLPLMAGG